MMLIGQLSSSVLIAVSTFEPCCFRKSDDVDDVLVDIFFKSSNLEVGKSSSKLTDDV